MDCFEVLRKNSITQGMLDDEVKKLGELFHRKNAKKGTIIIKEGEKSSELFVIDTGRVSVQVLSTQLPSEKEIITYLKDGDVIGEFSFIDAAPRSATVVAEEDTRLFYANYLDLHRFLDKNEHIGFLFYKNISKILTSKLRNMNLGMRDALL
ncbi:MAG: cyclic nucleotide-binding domain-containing protein [Candidatus Marinimicrobia bacterium]|nr:cyclic nucleotide-binding domain-containing protein [Candidatus Neomarinimicrobiota bacterium]